METRAWLRSHPAWQTPLVDVILAAGVTLDEQLTDGPPIVVIASEPPRQHAFLRTVRAWLPEHASPAEIAASIVAASQDLIALTQTQARQWLRETEDEPAFIETLTPREGQVLRMMADGLGNKEIAARLAISGHTAKFHVAQILAKLGAASRAEAVVIGIRRGLVPI